MNGFPSLGRRPRVWALDDRHDVHSTALHLERRTKRSRKKRSARKRQSSPTPTARSRKPSGSGTGRITITAGSAGRKQRERLPARRLLLLAAQAGAIGILREQRGNVRLPAMARVSDGLSRAPTTPGIVKGAVAQADMACG